MCLGRFPLVGPRRELLRDNRLRAVRLGGQVVTAGLNYRQPDEAADECPGVALQDADADSAEVEFVELWNASTSVLDLWGYR